MKKLILSMTFALMGWMAAMGCTNFLVGKNASNNGQTMITYAADSYSLYGFLRFQAAADHAAGELRPVYDWDTNKKLCDIPQIAHTYTVVGNTNEHQLTIGETTYGGREELWDTTGLVDYGSLIYIALERCKTAREAIVCMTDLMTQYGYYSEGESFSIGDPNEVWIMEVIGKGVGNKGAVWVATRIPDDCISGHANQARIHKLPVAKAKKAKKKDKYVTATDEQGMEWMWSKDVISFAREKGYFSGKDADFSFCDAYAPLDLGGAYACEARVWSFLRKFNGDFDQYIPYIMGKDPQHKMPLYIRPNHKVSAKELRACMRDQYEGTPLDITQGESAGIWHSKLRYGGLVFKLDDTEYYWPRPTATQQTGWSYVSEMYANKPYGIFWFGVDDAACNVYVPFFSCTNRVPNCMAEGNGDLLTYSQTSAFWAFNTVANYAYTKYERMYPEISFRQQTWEDRFEQDLLRLEEKIGKMHPSLAADYLTDYSCLQAEALVNDWKELFQFLVVKFLDGVEKKQDAEGNFLRTPEGESQSPNRLKPSEEWLRKVSNEAVAVK